MGDAVLYDLTDHVATITYNRPEALNAVNGALRADLNDAFARFRDDEDAWVAIVTGAGRAFCVGADLKDGAGSTGVFPGTFWEKPTMNWLSAGSGSARLPIGSLPLTGVWVGPVVVNMGAPISARASAPTACAPTVGRESSKVRIAACPLELLPSRARASFSSSFSLPPSRQEPGIRQSSRAKFA